MKIVSRTKVIYSFDPGHEPSAQVKPGERVLLQTQDAFGGQIRRGSDSVADLDWSKVDGATGPIFVENAEKGDTLKVEIQDIRTERVGVVVTVPKYGILGKSKFNPATMVVNIRGKHIHFEKGIQIRADPMIGTIGVTPETGSIPTGSLGKHGGNMDVKEVRTGSKLYLPVFMDGALFAAGDMHAVQADGELCVSAIEVAGEALLKFDLIKNRQPEWPILETDECFAVLACGDSLEDAARFSTETAVRALMRQHSWPFEKAYMFGSLAIDLRINQVVDPKKGVRASISKKYMGLSSLLT